MLKTLEVIKIKLNIYIKHFVCTEKEVDVEKNRTNFTFI